MLARLSYDPEYGARPAGRVLQREILSPLAEILLSGDATPNAIIHIDAVETPAAPVAGETEPGPPDYEFIFTVSDAETDAQPDAIVPDALSLQTPTPEEISL